MCQSANTNASSRENSLVVTRDKPDDPYDETVVPDDSHSDVGRPECERNDDDDDTNAPIQYTSASSVVRPSLQHATAFHSPSGSMLGGSFFRFIGLLGGGGGSGESSCTLSTPVCMR
jgi:hypothetical protein